MTASFTAPDGLRDGQNLHRTHLRRDDGRVLSYQVVGEGPPVLLIAGFGCSGSSWIPWLQRVQPHRFRALLLDNRGTGASTGNRRPYGLESIADDAAAVLQQEAKEKACLIVGHSMGGMIAQHVALRHPHRVGGLVLTASAPQRPAFERAALRSLPLSLLSMVSRNVVIWSLCDTMLVHPHKQREQAHQLLEPLRRIQRQEPYSRLNAWMQLGAIARHSALDRLRTIRVPVEVIVGVGDRVLAPDNSRLIAHHIPKATLTILDDVGHEIPHEAPHSILRAISRLLGRNDTPSG